MPTQPRRIIGLLTAASTLISCNEARPVMVREMPRLEGTYCDPREAESRELVLQADGTYTLTDRATANVLESGAWSVNENRSNDGAGYLLFSVRAGVMKDTDEVLGALLVYASGEDVRIGSGTSPERYFVRRSSCALGHAR